MFMSQPKTTHKSQNIQSQNIHWGKSIKIREFHSLLKIETIIRKKSCMTDTLTNNIKLLYSVPIDLDSG